MLNSTFVPIKAIAYIELLSEKEIDFDSRAVSPQQVLASCEKWYTKSYMEYLDNLFKIRGLADSMVKMFSFRSPLEIVNGITNEITNGKVDRFDSAKIIEYFGDSILTDNIIEIIDDYYNKCKEFTNLSI